MGGTKNTMLLNQPDDLAITLRQLHRGNSGCAFETGKTMGLHPAMLADTKKRK
jgi:hypothetical protein